MPEDFAAPVPSMMMRQERVFIRNRLASSYPRSQNRDLGHPWLAVGQTALARLGVRGFPIHSPERRRKEGKPRFQGRIRLSDLFDGGAPPRSETSCEKNREIGR